MNGFIFMCILLMVIAVAGFLFFTAIPIFLRAHTYVALEVFPEKRHIREVQRIGDIVDGKVRRF